MMILEWSSFPTQRAEHDMPQRAALASACVLCYKIRIGSSYLLIALELERSKSVILAGQLSLFLLLLDQSFRQCPLSSRMLSPYC